MGKDKEHNHNVVIAQINDLKKKLQLIDAERRARRDEGKEEKKRNEQKLSRLKKKCAELNLQYLELCKLGEVDMLLLKLAQHEIETTKFRSKSTKEVMQILDEKVSEIVKAADLMSHHSEKMQEKILYFTRSCAEINQEKFTLEKKLDVPTPHSLSAIQSKVQNMQQKNSEAEHLYRHYIGIRYAMENEKLHYRAMLEKVELQIQGYRSEAQKVKDMYETALLARNASRVELQQYEETLLLSNRETDRLLSEYKRHIDDVKAVTVESTTLKVVPGLGTSRSRPVTPPWNTNPCSMADNELVDLKNACEQLKAVTGCGDLEGIIQKLTGQEEKCKELREQNAFVKHQLEHLQQEKAVLASVKRMSGTAERQSGAKIGENIDQEPKDHRGYKPTREIRDIGVLLEKICYRIPYGPVKHQKGSLGSLLILCKEKIIFLMDKLEAVDVETALLEQSSEETVNKLPLDSRNSLSDQGCQADTKDQEESNKLQEDSDTEEAEVITRNYIKRQSKLLVEARTKKFSARTRRGANE